MTRKKTYLAIVTVLCVALAACLGTSLLRAYHQGMAARAGGDVLASIYTREQAVQRLVWLLPLLIIMAAAALYGLLKGIRDESALTAAMSPRLMRDLLSSRLDSLPDGAAAEERTQRRTRVMGWGGAAVCMIPVIAHMLNPDHFPGAGELESMIRQLAMALIPCAAAAVIALTAAACAEDRSIQREITQLRAAPLPYMNPVGEERSHAFGAVRLALILAALAMIVLGVMNGSMKDVLIKAINLCTECVGLG